MSNYPRRVIATAAMFVGISVPCATGQDVTYEERDGVRYQVTRQVMQQQVPTTVMQDRKQTQYVQQVTTEQVNHQQVYSVPVTQYQMRPYLQGRWNPFVTPYWTYHYEPVTQWQQQVANVQIPVSRVAWVPQETTVQVPVVEYRTAEREIVTRVAVNQPSAVATAQPLPGNQPSTANQGWSNTPTQSALGGRALESDPPRQSSGWQTPTNNGSRYR